MAQIQIQLEKGELKFYLDDHEVRRNSRIELLKDNVWVAGCLRMAVNPLRVLLVPDTFENHNAIKLTEKSNLRFSSPRQGNARSYLDTIGMLTAHYKSQSVPHLDARLKDDTVTLTLLGRTVKIGDKLLLHKRDDWVAGRIEMPTTPFRVIFAFENYGTIRLDAMHRLKWPERKSSVNDDASKTR